MSKKNKIIIASSAMAVLIAATIGVSVSFVNAPQDVAKPDDVEIIIEDAEPTIAEDENETFAPEEHVVAEKITEEVEEVMPSSTYTYTEPTYQSYTPTYSEPTYTQQYQPNGSGLTKEGGINYYNGRTESWYSSNVLYHYRTPEWTAGAGICDAVRLEFFGCSFADDRCRLPVFADSDDVPVQLSVQENCEIYGAGRRCGHQ